MLKANPCALCRHQFAKIEFPDTTKMVEWAQMIEKREPMATNVIDLWMGCHCIPNVVLTRINKMPCTTGITQT
jgi:hypothetical protein